RAGRLVPGGRDAPQLGRDGGRHRAELPLTGEELSERVADMDHPDVGRCDAARRERVGHDLADQVGEVQPGTGPVAREVGLVTAEQPGHGNRLLATTFPADYT